MPIYSGSCSNNLLCGNVLVVCSSMACLAQKCAENSLRGTVSPCSCELQEQGGEKINFKVGEQFAN